ESVTRRGNSGRASSRLRSLLGLNHPAERVRQRWKLDGFAGPILGSVWLQPVFLVAGPLLEERSLLMDRPRRAVALRKPMFGIADGRRRHLGNAHRAPALEHREGRVHRTRHDGRVEPLSIERLLARKIPLDVNRFWRPALPNHG